MFYRHGNLVTSTLNYQGSNLGSAVGSIAFDGSQSHGVVSLNFNAYDDSNGNVMQSNNSIQYYTYGSWLDSGNVNGFSHSLIENVANWNATGNFSYINEDFNLDVKSYDLYDPSDMEFNMFAYGTYDYEMGANQAKM